jgi:hypothetical protein
LLSDIPLLLPQQSISVVEQHEGTLTVKSSSTPPADSTNPKSANGEADLLHELPMEGADEKVYIITWLTVVD